MGSIRLLYLIHLLNRLHEEFVGPIFGKIKRGGKFEKRKNGPLGSRPFWLS